LGPAAVLGSDEDRTLPPLLLTADETVLEIIGSTGVVDIGSITNVTPDSFAVVVAAAVVVLSVEETGFILADVKF
jgi:hypothetical protein